MADDLEIKAFERLALVAGPSAALRLCNFYGLGSKNLYVPNAPTRDHEIERLVGREAFVCLVAEFSGETISIPTLDSMKYIRRAGLVHQLTRCGVPPRLMTSAIGLGEARIHQIQERLKQEGYGSFIESEEKA